MKNSHKPKIQKFTEIEVRYDYTPISSRTIKGEFAGFTSASGEGIELITMLSKNKKEVIFVPMSNVRYFRLTAIKNKITRECDVGYV